MKLYPNFNKLPYYMKKMILIYITIGEIVQKDVKGLRKLFKNIKKHTKFVKIKELKTQIF